MPSPGADGRGKDSTVVMELLCNDEMGCDGQWMYFREYVGQFQHYRKLAALAAASPPPGVGQSVLVAEQDLPDLSRLRNEHARPHRVHGLRRVFESARLCGGRSNASGQCMISSRRTSARISITSAVCSTCSKSTSHNGSVRCRSTSTRSSAATAVPTTPGAAPARSARSVSIDVQRSR